MRRPSDSAMFWGLWILMLGLSIIGVRYAHADEVWGTLCKNEASAEEILLAYNDGGFDLEDVRADALVLAGDCIRADREMGTDLYLVHQGKQMKDKVVIGLARSNRGPPLFFAVDFFPLEGWSQPKGSI